MTRRAARSIGALAALLVTACSPTANRTPVPQWTDIAEPDLADVETVLFLIGDAGNASFDRTPVLRRLQQDVEHYADALGRDSAVVVLFLGDNVYPEGMHPRELRDDFVRDSSRLHDQAYVVGGPVAARYHSPAFFVAGNHDWAIKGGDFGERMLKLQGELLGEFRERGVNARLLPEPGSSGPGVVDIGRNLRLVLFDTSWWLLSSSKRDKSGAMIRTEQAMRTRGDRVVVMAAHHPWASGGVHGEGMVPVWRTLGIKYFLAKSGALLQSLNSVPFRDFRTRLVEIFDRQGRPTIFAGGHEHTLQVIQPDTSHEPQWALVSGSASKTTDVGYVNGQRFRSDAPGYMRVMILKKGGVSLFVTGVPQEYLDCPQPDPAARERCVTDGVAAAKVLFSQQLR